MRLGERPGSHRNVHERRRRIVRVVPVDRHRVRLPRIDERPGQRHVVVFVDQVDIERQNEVAEGDEIHETETVVVDVMPDDALDVVRIAREKGVALRQDVVGLALPPRPRAARRGPMNVDQWRSPE